MFKVLVTFKSDPVKKFTHLRQSIENKFVRIAGNAAGGVMTAAVRNAAPKDHDFLARSIITKMKFFKAAVTWMTFTGASSKFKRKGKKITVGPNKGNRKTIRPARYAHLAGTNRTQYLKQAKAQAMAQFKSTFKAKLKQQIRKHR